ncbi:acyl-CoA thioesterase [Pseudozobellia thermophila]|uniref:Acyl-CoA thioester hydrolase n=1 Tax=Pseudozobellia thermophila TaxID=192903 RepID=A0A1M6FB75_9FLAO|nr:thioesterase family protein [Pseudozobellia thermophila]SHI94906.1 acyl-CoA thioester hydrolase [Pseudozobellia thermophila]
MNFNKISFRVRYGETDQMGVVYHGNYAQYLEIGRVEWLRSLGISYKEMEENGIILPVISLNIHFKKSAVYDDLITVETKLKKKPGVKIEFDYTIYNEKKEVLVLANTVLAFLDSKTKRPIKCPDYILEKIGDEGAGRT